MNKIFSTTTNKFSSTVPSTTTSTPSTTTSIRTNYDSIDTGFHDYKIDRKAGDPTRREFTYFMLGGGRLLYASVARLAVIRVSLSYSYSVYCSSVYL
mgnify:CR=1 FL=1